MVYVYVQVKGDRVGMNGALLFWININQTLTFLNTAFYKLRGNRLKPFSVAKFVVHRCDPWKRWKFFHAILQNFWSHTCGEMDNRNSLYVAGEVQRAWR
jgi:hypothetical protein